MSSSGHHDEHECQEEQLESQDVGDPFAVHGGDPRELDLGKSLLVSKLPSSFLNDSFDVFSECVYELLTEEFKIMRDAVEKIVRIPKLQADADSQDNALRAVVMFKSRVHKHRVIAQQKLATLDGTLYVSPIDEIPAEMLELDDVEVADEVGEDDHHDDHVTLDEVDEDKQEEPTEENDEPKTDESKNEAKSPIKTEDKKDLKNEIKDGSDEAIDGCILANLADKKVEEKDVKKKIERPKKIYIDDDLKAPFELSWDGAPEFQWKICTAPGDSHKLILENIFYADIHNPFIYRCMIRAESVEMHFPMRFNIAGNKQMYGKINLHFQYANEVMEEAVRHLIYVRCAEGRRIKCYLPQTAQAMKQKDELEEKLGHMIKPTPRMHQLVLKVLPKEEYSIDDAKSWFPEVTDQIINWEQLEDEIGQPIGLVTFSSAEATVTAHSSHTFLHVSTSTDKTAKVHVFMRGVEAHFGSFLTRWDQKKARDFYGEPSKPVYKRPAIAESRGPPPQKRVRPGPPAPRDPTRSSRGGAFSQSYSRNPPPFAAPDNYSRGRGEGAGGWRNDGYGQRYGNEGPTRFPSSSYENRREPFYSGARGGYSRR